MSADEHTSSPPKRKRHRSIQACLECRRLKLRCHGVDEDLRCTRCAKRDLRCEWATSGHPDFTTSRAASSSNHASGSGGGGFKVEAKREDDPLSVLNQAALRSYSATKLDDLSDVAARQPSLSVESTSASTSLQRRRSEQQVNGWTAGRLDEIRKERIRYFSVAHAPEGEPVGGVDAVQRASLSDEDVERLFTLFFDILNRQTPILDPQLHRSWRWVKSRSNVLLLVILAISASVDTHPRSIRPAAILSRDMEESISSVILSNAKSLEIAQALLLAYLFPAKTHHLAGDRSWLLLDTAARILTDLRIGLNMSTSGHMRPEDCADREQRNGQRTYLASLVLEKSLSTFVGAERQRRLDLRWQTLSLWTRADVTFAGDVQNVAYLHIRRLEHDVYDRLSNIRIDQDINDDYSSLQAWVNVRFDHWKTTWTDHPLMRADGYTRNFTLLVGLHIQLLLNIKLLHAMQSIGDRKASRTASTHCVDLACNLCRHFLRHFGENAHQLCRNPVAMVVSSSLMLLQLDSQRGLPLCWDVALAIAGRAEDASFSSSYSTFLGQTLLSIVNDIDSTSSTSGRNGLKQDTTNVDISDPYGAAAPTTTSALTAPLSADNPLQHLSSSSVQASSVLQQEQWDPDVIQQYINSFLGLSGGA